MTLPAQRAHGLCVCMHLYLLKPAPGCPQMLTGAWPMQDSLNRIVPEGLQYRHLDEGMDDMPAHVKSSLMGASLTVPIQQGRLALGTWQVGALPVLLPL